VWILKSWNRRKTFIKSEVGQTLWVINVNRREQNNSSKSLSGEMYSIAAAEGQI